MAPRIGEATVKTTMSVRTRMLAASLTSACVLGVSRPGTSKALGAEEKLPLQFDKARSPQASRLHAEAVAESLIPIRPGVPGKVPSWNVKARRFTYAPAFDVGIAAVALGTGQSFRRRRVRS